MHQLICVSPHSTSAQLEGAEPLALSDIHRDCASRLEPTTIQRHVCKAGCSCIHDADARRRRVTLVDPTAQYLPPCLSLAICFFYLSCNVFRLSEHGVANPAHRKMMIEYVTKQSGLVCSGGCHCQAVRFEVKFPPKQMIAWDCNCSICDMKRNTHIVVPSCDFHLLTSPKALTNYTFGTHTAQHMFCSTCGVTPFYVPRSNPDGYAITVHCLDNWQEMDIVLKQFDGTHWDESFCQTGIGECSRVT